MKTKPTIIESRRVDATYGIGTCVSFIKGFHDPKYKTFFDGEERCNHIFNTVVEEGDTVGADDIFEVTFYPVHHHQKRMRIKFYSSEDKDIFYTTGEWGKGICKPKHTVSKIGEIIVEMPILDGDKKRGVDVKLSFSHAEISVRAFDLTSKKEFRAIFDFLTQN